MKKMKVSLTNWVLTNKNIQNIGDYCSDRRGKIGDLYSYGLSVDASTEQISNKQETICRDETVKDSIQVSGSIDDLKEIGGLPVSESKANIRLTRLT